MLMSDSSRLDWSSQVDPMTYEDIRFYCEQNCNWPDFPNSEQVWLLQVYALN